MKTPNYRAETSSWLKAERLAARASYRTCPDCGHRMPTPESMRLHRVRFCVGGAGTELKRLGEGGGSRTAPAANGIQGLLSLVREP